jgi:hypothetical protein
MRPCEIGAPQSTSPHANSSESVKKRDGWSISSSSTPSSASSSFFPMMADLTNDGDDGAEKKKAKSEYGATKSGGGFSSSSLSSSRMVDLTNVDDGTESKSEYGATKSGGEGFSSSTIDSTVNKSKGSNNAAPLKQPVLNPNATVEVLAKFAREYEVYCASLAVSIRRRSRRIKRRSKSTEPAAALLEWTCDLCTFVNEARAKKCGVCDHKKAADKSAIKAT